MRCLSLVLGVRRPEGGIANYRLPRLFFIYSRICESHGIIPNYMKLRMLLCGFLFPLIFFGCQEKETVKPVLDLDKTAISVGAESDFAEFSVISNVDWELFCSEDWVGLSPKTGKGSPDPVIVTVTVKANKNSDKRVAAVEVRAADLLKTLTVRQEGFAASEIVPEISVSPSRMDLPNEAGTVEISLESNVAWNASVGADWIALNPSSGDGGTPSTVKITVAANDSESSRSTVVSFTAGSVTTKLKIYQSGRPKPGADNGSDAGIDDWIKDDDELTAN